jgi:hypothetical protein
MAKPTLIGGVIIVLFSGKKTLMLILEDTTVDVRATKYIHFVYEERTSCVFCLPEKMCAAIR